MEFTEDQSFVVAPALSLTAGRRNFPTTGLFESLRTKSSQLAWSTGSSATEISSSPSLMPRLMATPESWILAMMYGACWAWNSNPSGPGSAKSTSIVSGCCGSLEEPVSSCRRCTSARNAWTSDSNSRLCASSSTLARRSRFSCCDSCSSRCSTMRAFLDP